MYICQKAPLTAALHDPAIFCTVRIFSGDKQSCIKHCMFTAAGSVSLEQ